MPEPVIVARHDARCREFALDELVRAVGRAVVRDDDVSPEVSHVGEYRPEARTEPVSLVRRDDDDCEVIHAWMKRRTRRSLSSRARDRQVPRAPPRRDRRRDAPRASRPPTARWHESEALLNEVA